MRALNHTLRLGTASLLAMVLGSYVFASGAEASAPEDLSRVNGSVEVDAGETMGRVSTVNGSVVVSRDASAEEVETVNGRIELRRGSRVVDAGSVVRGTIYLHREVDLRIHDDAETGEIVHNY